MKPFRVRKDAFHGSTCYVMAEGSKFAAASINIVLGGWDRLIGRSRRAVTETADMDVIL